MRSLRRPQVRLFTIAAPALIWLYYLRPLSLYLVLAACVPGLLLHMWSNGGPAARMQGKLRRVILGCIVVGAVFLIPLAIQEFSFKASQYGVAAEGSGLGSTLGLSREVDIRSLLHPSPFWMLKESSFYLQYHFLPGLAWYALVPFWLCGVFMSPRRSSPDLWILRIFAVGMLLLSIYSTATGYNDPMRTRVPALPYLVLFSAWTFAHMQAHPTVRQRIYTVCGCCYALLLLSGIYDLLNDTFSLPTIAAIVAFVPAFVYTAIYASKKLSRPWPV
jgi:hypothetical protein